MILGYQGILGYNAGLESAIPVTNSNFDKLKLCGNITIDELQVLSTVLSKAEILELTTEQEFGVFTILLAHFENSLQGGNFDSGELDITHWNILRKKVDELNYELLTQVENTTVTQYLDIRAQSGVEYNYAIQAVASGTSGNIVESEAISMDFDGWSLQSLDYDPDEDIGTLYTFNVDISTDSIKSNESRSEITTFNQYVKVFYGESDYISGGLTTFPLSYNDDDEVVEPNLDMITSLKAFINNREEKILKNGSGLIYKVDTNSFSWKYRDELNNQQSTSTNENEQPYDISFKFVEVGEV